MKKKPLTCIFWILLDDPHHLVLPDVVGALAIALVFVLLLSVFALRSFSLRLLLFLFVAISSSAFVAVLLFFVDLGPQAAQIAFTANKPCSATSQRKRAVLLFVTYLSVLVSLLIRASLMCDGGIGFGGGGVSAFSGCGCSCCCWCDAVAESPLPSSAVPVAAVAVVVAGQTLPPLLREARRDSGGGGKEGCDWKRKNEKR